MSELGMRLQYIRVQRGLDICEVAARVGIFPEEIQQLELGVSKSDVPFEVLARLASVLEVTIAFLAGDIQRPTVALPLNLNRELCHPF